MIDFVGTPSFLRIYFWGIFFRIQGVPGNNLAPMKNCPGVQGRSN